MFCVLVIQECMQMSGWQTLMRSAILCSRAEYFTDQHTAKKHAPFGEWFVVLILLCKQNDFEILGMVMHVK